MTQKLALASLFWVALGLTPAAPPASGQGVEPGEVVRALPEGDRPYLEEARSPYPELYVVNPLYAPVTLRVRLEGTNLRFSAGEEVERVFPPRSRTLASSAAPAGPGGWGYRYRFEYVMGDVRATPLDPLYDLPFPAGRPFRVSQGHRGAFSHTGPFEYALDFEMPEGTPVLAAREGTVVATQGGHAEGGPDRALTDKANFVTVLHADGSLATYAHLRLGGVAVAAGQPVARGQLLGYSGNTGFSSGPHLHFHVYRALSPQGAWTTIPVRFRTDREAGVWLAQGLVYTRAP